MDTMLWTVDVKQSVLLIITAVCTIAVCAG